MIGYKPTAKKNGWSVFTECWRGLTSLLFPRTCLLCERRIDSEDNPVCPKCWHNLRPLSADTIHAKQPADGSLDGIYPVFEFDDAFQKIIHGLKYRGYRSLGIRIGQLMSDYIPADFYSSEAILVPIPLHPVKLRERGYNQSALIARGIAEKTGLQIREDCLRRVRNTVTQTHLNAQERVENMKGAFAVSGKEALRQFDSVLLVDDVFTTGATIGAAAAVLKTTGIAAVRGLTAAAPI